MASIQRSLNTLQYYTGIQNGVLIIEVSAIQRFVIERFQCSRFSYSANTFFTSEEWTTSVQWTKYLVPICSVLNPDTYSQYPLYGGKPTTYHVHVYYRIDSTVSHLTMNTEGKRLELRMFHMKIHI